MWTLVVTTLVFAGSVAGGVAVNTTFLDFPDEGDVEKRPLRWRLRSALIRGRPGRASRNTAAKLWARPPAPRAVSSPSRKHGDPCSRRGAREGLCRSGGTDGGVAVSAGQFRASSRAPAATERADISDRHSLLTDLPAVLAKICCSPGGRRDHPATKAQRSSFHAGLGSDWSDGRNV
jgi:hypothetical protein